MEEVKKKRIEEGKTEKREEGKIAFRFHASHE